MYLRVVPSSTRWSNPSTLACHRLSSLALCSHSIGGHVLLWNSHSIEGRESRLERTENYPVFIRHSKWIISRFVQSCCRQSTWGRRCCRARIAKECCGFSQQQQQWVKEWRPVSQRDSDCRRRSLSAATERHRWMISPVDTASFSGDVLLRAARCVAVSFVSFSLTCASVGGWSVAVRAATSWWPPWSFMLLRDNCGKAFPIRSAS